MEEVESRFVHLLQPIRDLTKNWEVDVAAQLGEYLEEVKGRGGPCVPCAGLGRSGVPPFAPSCAGEEGGAFCLCPRCAADTLGSSLSLRCPQTQPANRRFVFLLLRVSQLDQICISFDNGKTTMNFIEAALLIQGSACIYSRKVRRPAAAAGSWPRSCRPACSAIPQPGPEAELHGGCSGILKDLNVTMANGNESI